MNFNYYMPRLKKYIPVLVLPFLLLSCDENELMTQTDYSTVPDAPDTSDAERIEKDNGLVIYIIEEGDGQFKVAERDRVLARYTMRSIRDGEMEIHDSTWADGSTSGTELNMATIITGVRQGMQGMREGGERVFVIPPELGYAGTDEEFADDTLHFHVELEQIFDE